MRWLPLLLALAVPGETRAQTDHLRAYRAAVDLYRRGDADEAVRMARSWKARDLRNDAAQIVDDRDAGFAPAVVALLTELITGDTSQESTERLAAAETLVNNLQHVSPDLKAFQERWYVFVASVLLEELTPSAARTLIDRGLRLVGNSARLQLWSGIAFEMSTYPHITCPSSGCRSPDDHQANRRDLLSAADAYRRVIVLSPNNADAHLRLGRLLHVLGDRSGAREELGLAQQMTNRIDVRYLVALFRADLNRDEGNLEAAAVDAARAVGLGPDYQSARMALAYLNDLLGNSDRSREIVAESLRQPWAGDPWWEFRQPPTDVDSLEWIRTSVRK